MRTSSPCVDPLPGVKGNPRCTLSAGRRLPYLYPRILSPRSRRALHVPGLSGRTKRMSQRDGTSNRGIACEM
eukprot:5670365-Pyramimonas_sp.AAC.1